jgi:hypothetical protein
MKQFRFIAFALFAAVLVLFGSGLAQQQDVEAIKDVVQQREELHNAGDAAGVSEQYMQDAVFYTPAGGVAEDVLAHQLTQGHRAPGRGPLRALVDAAHVQQLLGRRLPPTSHQSAPNEPADAEQTQGKEPDRAGNRLAEVETVRPHEAEYPQDIAKGN